MRSSRRAVLRFALGVALAAAVFVEVVPRIASYGSVAHRLATVSWPWIAALTAASLLDIATTALPWQAVLPQMRFVAALGFLRRLRVDRGAAAFAVAVTGIWSQVMILVYPLFGAIFVFATGELSSS